MLFLTKKYSQIKNIFFFATIIILLAGCQSGSSGLNSSYQSNTNYFKQYKRIKNKQYSRKNYNNNNNQNSQYQSYEPQYSSEEDMQERSIYTQKKSKKLNPQYEQISIFDNVEKKQENTSYKNNIDKNIIDSPAMHKATMRKYTIDGKWYYPSTTKIGSKYRGVASWYGPNFNGKKTSNGEVYDMHQFTAAHKTLPMNTIVKVTNLKNNKSSRVRINDRGPFVDDRIIDLSFATAKNLDVYEHGTTEVELEILGFNAAVGMNSKTSEQFKQTYLNNAVNLQIGVFSDKGKAVSIARDNETNAYMSKIVEFEDHKNNRTLYRVVLKNFKSEEEAIDFKDRMNLKGSFITGD